MSNSTIEILSDRCQVNTGEQVTYFAMTHPQARATAKSAGTQIALLHSHIAELEAENAKLRLLSGLYEQDMEATDGEART